jgi:hypothetical protein
MKDSNLVSAFIHLGEWLREHDIDPETVAVSIRPPDWSVEGALNNAVRHDMPVELVTVPQLTAPRGEHQVCGIKLRIESPK